MAISQDEEFRVGERCELSQLGRQRCARYRSVTGTIVKAPTNAGSVRILFDGSKNPRSLHRTYLVRCAAPANETAEVAV